jgi:hypothetical protein
MYMSYLYLYNTIHSSKCLTQFHFTVFIIHKQRNHREMVTTINLINIFCQSYLKDDLEQLYHPLDFLFSNGFSNGLA